MADTSIEWTRSDDGTPGAVWNPSSGCDKVSPGCGLPRPGSDDEETGLTGGCYALGMAKRLKAMGQAKYQNDGNPKTSGPGFGVTMHPDALTIPLGWKKPRRVFVNSMSDLFHDKIDAVFIAQVFAVMSLSWQHTFQLLTKRHGRMKTLLNSENFPIVVQDEREELQPGCGELRWPIPNVHIGVSAEDQHWADIRIPALLGTPAAVRWISAEPLLGSVDLSMWLSPWNRAVAHSKVFPEHVLGPYEDVCGETQIDCSDCDFTTECRALDWLVCGGESGPGARPMNPDWARSLRDQCGQAGTAYFHKQNGAYVPVADKPAWGDVWVHPDGSTTAWDSDDGHIRHGLGDFKLGDAVLVRKVGKKAAGRLLDGRTWDEFPQPVEVRHG